MYNKVIKRWLDLVLSATGIILLSWLLVILSLLVKMTSKGPVFFKQRRIGIHKREFHILKFRTMYTETPKDVPTHLLENPNRFITPVGRFLRKTSLDELPQLFNIFSGKMAFVGPRPALWNQEDLILQREKYGANDIRPGLTGWAQINGRDELPINRKAELDGQYVNRMSFLFDLQCILKTGLCVLNGKGLQEGKQYEESEERNQGKECRQEK